MMVTCLYCSRAAKLVTGEEVYPHRPDLADKHFYKCAPCGAWVGCHPGSKAPLGRLANARLRSLKSQAHKEFDPLWLGNAMARSDAYAWLAEQLGVPISKCHIGEFSEAQCLRVIEICRAKVAA